MCVALEVEENTKTNTNLENNKSQLWSPALIILSDLEIRKSNVNNNRA